MRIVEAKLVAVFLFLDFGLAYGVGTIFMDKSAEEISIVFCAFLSVMSFVVAVHTLITAKLKTIYSMSTLMVRIEGLTAQNRTKQFFSCVVFFISGLCAYIAYRMLL